MKERMSYLEMAKQAEARLRAEGKWPGSSVYGVVSKAGAAHVPDAQPFLHMKLDQFQTAGACLEVRVPWLSTTLWMVPTDRDVSTLIAEGVSRGRIWTTSELLDLMAVADRSYDALKTITHTKLTMDGDVVAIRRRT